MCRIAEVLIALQQVGNVKYIGCSLQFDCQTHLVGDLQQQAREMEDELERWNDEVTKARDEFYELNYYTTRQLLVLRSQLGKMKTSEPVTPLQQAQVMALLQSISSVVTPRDVETVVRHVAIQFSEGRRTLDRPKSPPPRKRQTASMDIEPPLAGCFPPPTSPPPSPSLQENTLPSVAHLPTQGSKVSAAFTLPTPSLTRDDLSEKQNEYYTNVIEKCGYSELTSLKAIEEVGSGDWNDIENWLEKNGEKYDELFEVADQEESDGEGEEEGLETDDDSDEISSGSGDTPPERAQDFEDMQQESTPQGG